MSDLLSTLLLPAAALAAVAIAILPAAWGMRVWAALTVLLASWHLSGKTNDTGLGLEPGMLSDWSALAAISLVLGGLIGVALRAGKPGPTPSPRTLAIGSAVLAFVAVLPLGSFLLSLASLALAGSAHPVVWHVGILVAAAGLAGLACLRVRLPWCGLALGLAASCAWATIDSLRLETTLLARMNDWYNQPGMQKCLGTGPEGRALTNQRPLTALTVERPLRLRVVDEPELESQYWSFRERLFISTNPPPPMPTCEPSSEPLLPG